MLEAVPKSPKEGQKARESPTDKAWLINEAQDWAKETMKTDQGWRLDKKVIAEREEIHSIFVKLGIDIAKYELFLQSEPVLDDEITLKKRLQAFLDKINEMGSDEENQVLLKQLLDKIGGFPSISEYGRYVSHTAWIVFQHADNDRLFQKKGLEMMYECRKQRSNEPSVELGDFYFLTDRITIALYGYQFFGTQNNKANLISLPDNIKINFARNPALFCTKLVEREFPKELRSSPSNLEMYHL